MNHQPSSVQSTVVHAPDARRIEPEILDTLPEEAARASLRDLTRINRWLGGYSIVRGIFGRLTAPGEEFTVLDVGAASGDMGAAISGVRPGASVVPLDRRMEHLHAASGSRIVGDAFHLPFAPASFDFVFCSLFLHHFEDAAIVTLLAGFCTIARRGLVVIDLERSGFAAEFLARTQWLFGWDPVTVHDARLSVCAAFRKAELEAMARAAGLMRIEVRRHVPWSRLSLVAER